ncbi:hypothetical protein [Acetobacter thailandicus]|uniref:hypothetical protein n=1 Tax=Acetobacter thailandicus TaxID=1502842 RepID=UPI001BA6A946|nr:hypothetical protein [Acetobacter thailandicus]MBS0981495.1 hypothetical protein [Acetobacter thailandicus]
MRTANDHSRNTEKLPSFASQVWTLTQGKQLTATAHLVLRALASFEERRSNDENRDFSN